HMLAGLAGERRPKGPTGGVFFKAPKPEQERRIDLPVIGLGTVQGVARAGLNGLVIEAGGVMVLDLAGVVAACDAAGVFLWVRKP
ncbi:MAG: UDP-2,3-diacylglucosamine diphosphatase LpxI, partial [Pseudomonadota bacterium]